ncbi:hypothetical protein B0O99DRAFT_643991 [Bisporella sp. PMI_857]|nr:hypothetical protein B0O99DRAFT_643991 [Bisporella sp. PMI_857]
MSIIWNKLKAWLGLAAGISKFGYDSYQTYKIGADVQQFMPYIEFLLPALEGTLGAMKTAALVQTFALPLGVAGIYMLVLQGSAAAKELGRIADSLDAQTSLKAQSEFARHVYEYIELRCRQVQEDRVEHYFFVYHPDTDWYPSFSRIIERYGGLPSQVFGISENLDFLCYWMKAVRQCLLYIKGGKYAKFHLLIPSYRRMIIMDPLSFSSQLYPLVVEGEIHDSHPYVWLNVPERSEELLLWRIGDARKLTPDPNFSNLWGWTESLSKLFSGPELPPRILGESPGSSVRSYEVSDLNSGINALPRRRRRRRRGYSRSR